MRNSFLEISEPVSALSLQIDRLLEDDLVQVLRDAGGQTGADLADAIRWLADEDY